jgi:hypothetical protein
MRSIPVARLELQKTANHACYRALIPGTQAGFQIEVGLEIMHPVFNPQAVV